MKTLHQQLLEMATSKKFCYSITNDIMPIVREWLQEYEGYPKEAIQIIEKNEKEYPAPLSKQFHKGELYMLEKLIKRLK